MEIVPDKKIILSPSQDKIINELPIILQKFNMVVIKGDLLTGKKFLIQEFINRHVNNVERFDICLWASSLKTNISNQHLVSYLNSLLTKLTSHNNNNNKNNKKRKLSSKDLLEQYEYMENDKIDLIYIENFNKIVDVLCDANSELRFLLPLVFKDFVSKLPSNVKIIITTNICCLPEGTHWCIELENNSDDIIFILQKYVLDNIITNDIAQNIFNTCKNVSIGKLVFALNYAELYKDSCDIEKYIKQGLNTFSGTSVEVKKDVPNPDINNDLIGLENIIEELNISILTPLKHGLKEIPIQKGILLCGPPGTGKTSIGRWLAHQIDGKFYLLGGEGIINGEMLIRSLEKIMRQAKLNAPAVIFIDDGDILFDHDDTYRAFLTMLDGIENNKRNNICVILTCMNMRKIPSSLLRGGRLELTIFTNLPTKNHIEKILYQSINKIAKSLNLNNILNQVNDDFIKTIATKMIGWNCADIQRSVQDVFRLILYGKPENLLELFNISIKKIQTQYEFCGKCESTNQEYQPYQSYIN